MVEPIELFGFNCDKVHIRLLKTCSALLDIFANADRIFATVDF